MIPDSEYAMKMEVLKYIKEIKVGKKRKKKKVVPEQPTRGGTGSWAAVYDLHLLSPLLGRE